MCQKVVARELWRLERSLHLVLLPFSLRSYTRRVVSAHMAHRLTIDVPCERKGHAACITGSRATRRDAGEHACGAARVTLA